MLMLSFLKNRFHLIKSIKNGLSNRNLLVNGHLLCLNMLNARKNGPDPIVSESLKRIPRLSASLLNLDKFDTTLASLVFSDKVIQSSLSENEKINKSAIMVTYGFSSPDLIRASFDPYTHLVYGIDIKGYIWQRNIHVIAGDMIKMYVFFFFLLMSLIFRNNRGQLQIQSEIVGLNVYKGKAHILESSRLFVGNIEKNLIKESTWIQLPFLMATKMTRRDGDLLILHGNDIWRIMGLEILLVYDLHNFPQIKQVSGNFFSTETQVFKNDENKETELILETTGPIKHLVSTLSSLFVFVGDSLWEFRDGLFVQLQVEMKQYSILELVPVFQSLLIVSRKDMHILTDWFTVVKLAQQVNFISSLAGVGNKNMADYYSALSILESAPIIKNASEYFKMIHEENLALSQSTKVSSQGEFGSFSSSIRTSLDLLSSAVSSLAANKDLSFTSFGAMSTFALERSFGQLRYGTGTNYQPDFLAFSEKLRNLQFIKSSKGTMPFYYPSSPGQYQDAGVELCESKFLFTLDKKKREDISQEDISFLHAYAATFSIEKKITTTSINRSKRQKTE
jgi:hypothetical protein